MSTLARVADPFGVWRRAGRELAELADAITWRAERTAVDVLDRAIRRALHGEVADVVLRAAIEQGLVERVVEELLAGGVVDHVVERAMRGPELDRLLTQALASPRVEELTAQALDSEAADRLVAQVLESRLLDATVARVLASEELWLVVDEIAQSPAVTEAIGRQGVGFADQVAGEVGERTRRADAVLERVARRLTFRPPRPGAPAP
jgi:hypothetical protein